MPRLTTNPHRHHFPPADQRALRHDRGGDISRGRSEASAAQLGGNAGSGFRRTAGEGSTAVLQKPPPLSWGKIPPIHLSRAKMPASGGWGEEGFPLHPPQPRENADFGWIEGRGGILPSSTPAGLKCRLRVDGGEEGFSLHPPQPHENVSFGWIEGGGGILPSSTPAGLKCQLRVDGGEEGLPPHPPQPG